ncbi:unnamed protein product [Amaranthus hypochondriacus]
MEKDRKTFPIGIENYSLYEEIGEGVSASVYRALCIPNNEVVAIKILDFERYNSDLNTISQEAKTMILVDHVNVLKSHCSFVSDHNLWVVMPYMAGGSCLHLLKFAHSDGFEEIVIATILREVLKGLEYLHNHGHIHRDVKAGNILIGSRGAIKLGDLGVSACLFDSGDRRRMRNTFVGTPCWMAPEVLDKLHGYDFKADIWSFGITALELAHGHAPFSIFPPMKVLLMTLQSPPPSLKYDKDKKFSKLFKQMIASCLVKDPSKRPSAKKLIKHSFFKQARSNDYIYQKLLDNLPPLGDRIKVLKMKEEDMLAQKKMAFGEKEELSQSEYKRGISSWNFNLEDVKAQASLIQDDAILFDKDDGSIVDSPLDHHSQISDIDNNDLSNYSSHTPPPKNVFTSRAPRTKSEKPGDDSSISSSNYEKSTSACSSPRPLENVDNVATNGEGKGKMVINKGVPLHSRRASSSACGYTLEIPHHRAECLSLRSPKEMIMTVDETSSETTPRASKNSPVNNEDTESKLIQQKGRFKVTSENVDHEKVGTTTPFLTSWLPSPTGEVSTNNPKDSLFSHLQSILQANLMQRESILSAMRKVSSNSFNVNAIGDRGCTSTSVMDIEKSMLEASHDREKELLQEISTLHSRLIQSEAEIQKLKIEKVHVNDQRR